MGLLEHPDAFLKDRAAAQEGEGNLVQMVPHLFSFQGRSPTVEEVLVVGKDGGRGGSHKDHSEGHSTPGNPPQGQSQCSIFQPRESNP